MTFMYVHLNHCRYYPSSLCLIAKILPRACPGVRPSVRGDDATVPKPASAEQTDVRRTFGDGKRVPTPQFGGRVARHATCKGKWRGARGDSECSAIVDTLCVFHRCAVPKLCLMLESRCWNIAKAFIVNILVRRFLVISSCAQDVSHLSNDEVHPNDRRIL